MDYTKLVSFAIISLLGAMSPGPDFAIVVKNCLSGDFRKGVITALGVFTALLIHVSYCLLGIAVIIQSSPVIFNLIKYLGAGYLLYLGILLLKEKTSPEGPPEIAKEQMKKRNQSFIAGFLCNLLNPKATLFILSLFTQFIDSSMSLGTKAIFGLVVALTALVWFVFLSYLLTHRLFKQHFKRFQIVITKTMGIALCILALYVIFS